MLPEEGHPMTPEEFTAEMEQLAYGPEYADDPENQHLALDYTMAVFLRQLGYAKAIDAYWSVEKQYS